MISAWAALVAALLLAAPGEAYDQQVSSTFWAQGYSIPAYDGSMISRRRFVEDLHLAAWNLIPGSDDPYYRGPRISVEMKLRLDTDFAVTDRESRASQEASYVPGLTPLQADMMFAYVDARGFWDGALDARAGRQIRLDTVGFFAFDGIETTMHMPAYIDVSAYFGWEVRGGDILGFDQLELDGVDSGGRGSLENGLYEDRTDPEPRMAFGTEASWYPTRWFDAGVAVRLVGLSEELAEQRLAGRFSLGHKPMRVAGRVLWSPMLDRRDDFSKALSEGTAVTEADFSMTVIPIDALEVAAEYTLFRPTFEADSIFNVFDLTPRRDVGGKVTTRPTRPLSIAVWGYARLSENSAGLDGTVDSATFSGVVGGLGANWREDVRRLSARLSAQRDWGETRVGAEIGGGHGLFSNRLWLGLRLSYWKLEDDFSSALAGDVFGYIGSVRFKLSEGATVAGEIENYFGKGRDPRVVLLGLLQLDLWR